MTRRPGSRRDRRRERLIMPRAAGARLFWDGYAAAVADLSGPLAAAYAGKPAPPVRLPTQRQDDDRA